MTAPPKKQKVTIYKFARNTFSLTAVVIHDAYHTHAIKSVYDFDRGVDIEQ